jgi:hypothetical protein
MSWCRAANRYRYLLAHHPLHATGIGWAGLGKHQQGRGQAQHRPTSRVDEAERVAATVPIVLASQPWIRSTTPPSHLT